MEYNRDVLDLIIATINNGSVKIEYNTVHNVNEPIYVLQGFSFRENERNTGLSFEQLYTFYENKLKKIK